MHPVILYIPVVDRIQNVVNVMKESPMKIKLLDKTKIQVPYQALWYAQRFPHSCS